MLGIMVASYCIYQLKRMVIIEKPAVKESVF